MTLHPDTIKQLEHQYRWLTLFSKRIPPARDEAKKVRRKMDQILDERPRPVAVTADGEVVWPGSSPWVAGQAYATSLVARNSTGHAERVMTPEEIEMIARDGARAMGIPVDDDDDPPPAGSGGGVGLLDRP